MKRFDCGLVVGKFSPLHLGHERLIRRAQEECEQVLVISYSKPEYSGCAAERREEWLRRRFPTARICVLDDGRLAAVPGLSERWPRLPENSEDGIVHEHFCADICRFFFGARVDAVYSSEHYGPSFARTLAEDFREPGGVAHQVEAVTVDLERVQIPVSGTQLRADRLLLRQWVAPEVYASFVRRVCFLGGESTGKTTLAKALADRFQTRVALEYGRELWERKNGALCFGDLLEIGRAQIQREEALAAVAKDVLFCDTSPLTTLLYSLDLFGEAEAELVRLSFRSYDLVVLCADDFDFVQDGTRRDGAFRQRQQSEYRRILDERRVTYLEVYGSVADRAAAVCRALDGEGRLKG